MTLDEQKQLIELMSKYNTIDRKIIQSNLVYHIDASGYKNKFIAEKMRVTDQTIYGWRKSDKFNIPTFETALKLCDLLQIPITELLKN